jgi:hypothetical protein
MRNAEATGAPESTRTIALWGASQVGKTTTLAAYLGKHRPQWIDRNHRATQTTLHELQEIWSTLQRNQVVPGTSSFTPHTLRHREQCTLLFRDMKGANARSLRAHAEDAQALVEADAAMIFLEWPGPRGVEARSAIDNALQMLGREHPTALVITKCESYLTLGELSDFAEDPLGFARGYAPLGDLLDSLSSFVEHFRHGAVFPVTVYGWNGSRPAHFYDEFGRLVPWNIRPALVDRPFEYILSRLALGTTFS